MAHVPTLTQGNAAVDAEEQQPAKSHEAGDAIIEIDDNATNGATPVVKSAVNYSEKSLNGTKQDQLTARKAAELEINDTITESLQNYPRGYPLQAAFQSSEPSFSIYRSFDYLHSRVILDLQDELRCLEENLAELDMTDDCNKRRQRLTSRATDLRQAKKLNVPCKRTELLSAIRQKLVNYDEILAKARDLNAFQRPSKRDYRSLRRWFYNEKPLSYEREEQFIKRKEDLITLRHGREWAGFDGLVEEMIRKMPCRLTRWLFTTPELRAKTDDDHIAYYSASRIEKLVGVIITALIFILLVLPVTAMYELTCIGNRNSTFDAVGILVVFTLLFSAAMSILTKAKRHELFAASATYAAVLVVFISNFDNHQTAIGVRPSVL